MRLERRRQRTALSGAVASGSTMIASAASGAVVVAGIAGTGLAGYSLGLSSTTIAPSEQSGPRVQAFFSTGREDPNNKSVVMPGSPASSARLPEVQTTTTVAPEPPAHTQNSAVSDGRYSLGLSQGHALLPATPPIPLLLPSVQDMEAAWRVQRFGQPALNHRVRGALTPFNRSHQCVGPCIPLLFDNITQRAAGFGEVFGNDV